MNNHTHLYRDLILVTKFPAAITFALPDAPAQIVARARLRAFSAAWSSWSLQIEGHRWPLDDGTKHPLAVVPGPVITGIQFKAFSTWQQAAREVIRVLGLAPAKIYPGFKEPIKPGDVLAYWHDTGAMGAQLCYVRVLKLGAKKIRVRYETSHDEAWLHAHHFAHTVKCDTLAELIAEGINV